MISDLAYIGVDVTLNRVKIFTDNLTGDEERYYGPDETVRMQFYHEMENKRLVESGYAREGAIICYAKPEDRIKKSDKITIQGEIYLVEANPLRKGFPNVAYFHEFSALKSSEQ